MGTAEIIVQRGGRGRGRAWKAYRTGPSWALTRMSRCPVVAMAYRCSPWRMTLMARWSCQLSACEWPQQDQCRPAARPRRCWLHSPVRRAGL